MRGSVAARWADWKRRGRPVARSSGHAALVAPPADTFPQTPLDLTAELQIDGTWTDITSYVYRRDMLTTTRGRSDEASQTERGTARMTVNNRDGRFSPRNPTGPYYGVIGQNTPLRVSVRRGDVFLDLPGDVGDRVFAADTPGLSVTGDIDIRVDLTASDWSAVDLCGKYVTTSNQRSWALQIDADGTLVFTWSPDGTLGNAVTINSTVPAPLYPGRRAIRVTLDVDNGASGNTVTFYTSDSINGTWTQLGDTVVTAGTTSIFDSTAPVEVGDVSSLTVIVGTAAASSPVTGHVHAFELRNGIGGTLVADPDFTAQTAGAGSFTDTIASAANLWTLQGGASITNRHWRFHGEVSEWPPRWDTSGTDVHTPIEASGVLRRLGQGEAPLKSTLFRGLVTLADNPPIAYWPMEDATGSTSIAPGILNGIPMRIYGSPSLATSEVFKCSDALPTCSNAGFNGKVGVQTMTGVVQIRFLVHIPTAGTTNNAVVCRVWTSGSIRRWDLRYTTASSGGLTLLAYDRDGALVHTSSTATGYNGSATRVSIEMEQNGADIDYVVQTMVGGADSSINGFPGTVSSNTFSTVTSVTLDPTLNMDDVTVGHLSVHSEITSILDLENELIAYVGETAGRRVERLCSEEGLEFRSIGDLDATERMGAQTPETLITLLTECAEADLGILYEPREALGIGYRARDSLYNQSPRIEIDYDASELSGSLEPTDDDQRTRNDITAARKGGSSARETLDEGPLSTQPPPDGVGTYQEQVTVNIEGDPRLPQHAAWHVHLGTADEERYPQVQVNSARSQIVANAALTEALLEHEFGDRLTIDNPPAWLPPNQISQIVQGYAETLGNFEHDMTLNCSPESPWQVGVYDTDHYDTAGSALAAAVSSTATSLSVATTQGPIWTTDSSDLPLDIGVGGERMTVTAISGSSSPQTFTVTRSVNGVTKSHSAGAAVSLFSPKVPAL